MQYNVAYQEKIFEKITTTRLLSLLKICNSPNSIPIPRVDIFTFLTISRFDHLKSRA